MNKTQKLLFAKQIWTAVQNVLPAWLQDNDEPLTKEEVETALGLPAQEDGMGGGFEITVNRTDQTINQVGLSDAQVTSLVEEKTADIANATTAIQYPTLNVITNTITIYNETAPITNNTVWNDPIEDTYPYLDYYFQISQNSLLIGDNILIHYYSSGHKYGILDIKTKEFKVIGDYGYLTMSYDTKRAIAMSYDKQKTYQIDRQADGSYTSKEISTFTGFASVNGCVSMLSFDGLKLYTPYSTFKIQDDGNWAEDSEPTILSGLGVDANYAILKTNEKYTLVGFGVNGRAVNIKILQEDGSYVSSSVGTDTNISDCYLTMDGMKLMIMTDYKLHTYYRKDDNTWELISTNNNATSSLGTELVSSIDGSIAIIPPRDSSTKLYKFTQKVPTITLDAYSTDPFEDGSLDLMLPLDSDTVEVVSNATVITTGTHTYSSAKHGNGDVYANTDQTISIEKAYTTKQPRTISLWIKRDGATNYDSIINGYISGEQTTLTITGHSDRIDMGLMVGSTSYLVQAPTLNDGAMHHLLLSSDGSNIVAYVDGSNIGSVDISNVVDENEVTAEGQTQNKLYVGYSGHNNPDNYYSFKGTIDHLQIFNRPLTQEEVTKLYQAEVK